MNLSNKVSFVAIEFVANSVFSCGVYFKIENNNMCSVDIIENDKNSEYAFGNTIFENNFY